MCMFVCVFVCVILNTVNRSFKKYVSVFKNLDDQARSNIVDSEVVIQVTYRDKSRELLSESFM